VIFVVDTSGSIAVIATIDANSRTQLELPARDPSLMPSLRKLASGGQVTKVAVAVGPGSFTGLRAGVSFGLGLAMGLRVPIVPLGTLDLQQARSDGVVTAIVDAGRGRYYHQPPGGKPLLAEPVEIASTYELVGNVADRRSLLGAGHRFKPEEELRTFVEAAEIVLRTAEEVPYRNLRIEYMQSFARKG
jgi:tRNA threonylcarbamoyl adenosine modification protein YeaZ